MRLELSLGKDQFVWAVVNPLGKSHIKTSPEPGYQTTNLILSQSNPGPVQVELEEYPSWAKAQIIKGINGGQLVNTGDKIDTPVATVTESVTVEAPAQEQKPTAKKKARSSRSKKTA